MYLVGYIGMWMMVINVGYILKYVGYAYYIGRLPVHGIGYAGCRLNMWIITSVTRLGDF